MELESQPIEIHKEERDNSAVNTDDGKQEQVSDSVEDNNVDKEDSKGGIDAEVLEVEEVTNTQEVIMEEETVDMEGKNGGDKIEPSESKEATPQHYEEVHGTSEPEEDVSETHEKVTEQTTDENHLSESIKRSEHTPETHESDTPIPKVFEPPQDAPDTTEHCEEAPSGKLIADAKSGNQVTSPEEVIKETTNADKLEAETTQSSYEMTKTSEPSEPIDSLELKPQAIDSEKVEKGPDASDHSDVVPTTIHSTELIPAAIDIGESTSERIDAGDQVPKTIDSSEPLTEPTELSQQVQERVESEEREMDIIVQAGAETGEEIISSDSTQLDVKSFEQESEQREATREVSYPWDSEAESDAMTQKTVTEQKEQLQNSTTITQTGEMIKETCQEIQQSTSVETKIEMTTSEHMTVKENEIAEPMQMERHEEVDRKNKSSDKVEEEQSMKVQDVDMGDEVINVSPEENQEKVSAEEINLDQAVEPSESRLETHYLAVEESEAKKMESQCLDKDNNRDEPEVKNKQVLELTDVLEYPQHTDSLHMMKTRENIKQNSQTETSGDSLDDAGKREIGGDFEEKLEELQSQSQSWVEFPDHEEEGTSEISEQDKKSTECPEIKIQDRMETDTQQVKDKICVASDAKEIDIGDKAQLDEIQLGACDGKDLKAEKENSEEDLTEQEEKHSTEEGKLHSIYSVIIYLEICFHIHQI